MTKTTTTAAAIQIKDTKTDKYATKVHPLNRDEYEALKKSMAEHGLYQPITINQHGDVLDGHHRLKACRELGIKPEFEVKEFDDELLEELFVIDNNLIRRQLSDYPRGVLALKRKPLLEELAKRNMSLGGKGDKVLAPLGRINKELAKQAGGDMSHEQLRKIEYIHKFEDSLPEETKQKLIAGDASIDSVHKVVKRSQDDDKPEQSPRDWAEELEGKSDLERFETFGKAEYQNDKPRVYNVWNFTQVDPRLGQEHPGQIPGQISMNVLYYYTEPGDIVVDPMAGGGSTIDACKVMGRECLAYDIDPKRPDIKKWDIRNGFPEEENANYDLVFLDPPYWNLKEKEYSEESISSLPLDRFMKVIKAIAKESYRALKPGGHVALVMEGIMDENWKYFIDLPTRCITTFEAVGFKQRQRIGVPLSSQVKTPWNVEVAKEKKRLLTLNRDLIIFRKEEGGLRLKRWKYQQQLKNS